MYALIPGSIPLARWAGRALTACAALLVLAACGGGDGPIDPPPPTSLAVTTAGRLERGSTITVTVTADGQALAPGGYTLSAQPADAVQLLGNGQVKLTRAGAVTLTASSGTRSGKTDLTVAAPPVVVFDRYAGSGGRDIWRVDLDGQNLIRLTTDTGEDLDPTVAAGKVVWISFRSGRAELYTMPLAGGADTRITNTVADESTPALSPDGARLAFAQAASGVTKVFVANADGTGAARATPNSFGFSGAIETAPAFAPASRLAFVATANGSADVFQVVGAAAPTLLAGGNAAEVEPAWNANGTMLAFVSNRNGGTEIFLLNTGTGAVSQLTSGAGAKSQPAWTPDGRVVYLETQGNATLLRWVDPAQPATVTTIDTGPGTVEHPAVTAAP